MIESLADIEALLLRCRSEQSKEYVSEAVLCYRSGAYRAAIVGTWIAVVFDLMDKIRELALSGDGAAVTLQTQYERYLEQVDQGNDQGIKSALEFERTILATCRNKLQLFDQQQFTDLCRLQEDRHRCAHPSFQRVGEPYRPSAEQARLHLRNAIVYVLAQPPIQGKAALAELKRLVASNYFPLVIDKAVTQLRSSAFSNATEALIRGFVDELMFGFVDKDSVLYNHPQVISALNAIEQMHPALVEQRLRTQLDKVIQTVSDDKFSGIAWMVAEVTSAAGVLSKPSKDKVDEFIRNGPIGEVLPHLQALGSLDSFIDAVRERVGTLEFASLVEGIQSYGLGRLAKEKALEYLSGCGSWNRTNEVFTNAVIPLFEHLDVNDIERIIRMPTQIGADLVGANSYSVFIERVRQTNIMETATLDCLLSENRAGYLVQQEEDQT